MSLVVLATVGLVALVWLATPLLMTWAYDPDACRSYSRRDVVEYVRQNIEREQLICGVNQPTLWNNDQPYVVSVCDHGGSSSQRVEVYPDCGLEHRFS